jgi:hypothetical protein
MRTIYKGTHYSASVDGNGCLVVSSRAYEARMNGKRAERFAAELAQSSPPEAHALCKAAILGVRAANE